MHTLKVIRLNNIGPTTEDTSFEDRKRGVTFTEKW
jgi:hypothetical protein